MARPSDTHGSGRQGELAPGRGARSLLPPPPSRRRGTDDRGSGHPKSDPSPLGGFLSGAGPGECARDPKVSRRQMWEGAGPAAEEAEEEREGGKEEGRKGAALSGEPGEGGKEGRGAGLPSPSQRENGEIDTKLLRGKVSCSQGKIYRPAPGRGRGRGRENRALLCGGRHSVLSAPGRWMPAAFLAAWPGCSSGSKAGSSSLPLSLLGCLLPPAAGAPARPPSSLLLPASRRWRAPWAGAPGTLLRAAAAERCAPCARARTGAPLGSAPNPAAVLKGQLPDCCGAVRGPAGVLRAGFGLRGRWALASVPLRPALRAPLRAGGWRCQPR